MFVFSFCYDIINPVIEFITGVIECLNLRLFRIINPAATSRRL